jgi:hypothetical protein
VTSPPSEPGEDTDEVEPAGSSSPAHRSDEEIDEASAESFPASDAPQWWSGEPDDHH